MSETDPIAETMERIRKKARLAKAESKSPAKPKRERAEKLQIYCAIIASGIIASGKGNLPDTARMLWDQWQRFAGDRND